MLKIETPKGTKGLYIGSNTDQSKNEYEMLLNKKLKYKVINKNDKEMVLRIINN